MSAPAPIVSWLPHIRTLRELDIRKQHTELLEEWGPDFPGIVVGMTAAMLDTSTEDVIRAVYGMASEGESEI